MRKNFKYNGVGVNSEFFKTLIINNNTFHGKLNLPKPESQEELTLLSKFIFGVELTCNFKYFTDHLSEEITKSIILRRYLKLIKLEKSSIDYIIDTQSSTKNKKMDLLRLSYECVQNHDDYYDGKFNYEVFKSSYEVDSYFWRHCIGELSCGGIARNSYGQVTITSLKEYERLKKLYNSKEIRKSFKK